MTEVEEPDNIRVRQVLRARKSAIIAIIAVVAIGFVAIKWILALMGFTVPDAILILGALLVLLLVFSGRLSIGLGLGGV